MRPPAVGYGVRTFEPIHGRSILAPNPPAGRTGGRGSAGSANGVDASGNGDPGPGGERAVRPPSGPVDAPGEPDR